MSTVAGETDVIAALRSMRPATLLGLDAACKLAERQAQRLLELSAVSEPPVPSEIVSGLTEVEVDCEAQLPVSALSFFADGTWMIALNAAEPPLRRRFSLLHEFKHVVDDPAVRADNGERTRAREEVLADYFAASVLMPSRWVRDADKRPSSIAALARTFAVSPAAMTRRLQELGLRPSAHGWHPHRRRCHCRAEGAQP